MAYRLPLAAREQGHGVQGFLPSDVRSFPIVLFERALGEVQTGPVFGVAHAAGPRTGHCGATGQTGATSGASNVSSIAITRISAKGHAAAAREKMALSPPPFRHHGFTAAARFTRHAPPRDHLSAGDGSLANTTN